MLHLLVGLIASAISLGRLYSADQELLAELVWAEDGLFPLCVANHGYWNCLWDPYAGYLLFLSRTLAVPVAYTPLDSWPLTTNLVAAFSSGALSALIFWLLIRIPIPRLAAAFSALVPVMLPITGLEAINAAGSLYMVLLVATTIAASANFHRPLPPWVLPSLLCVTALTIPLAILLAFPLAVRYLRKTITVRQVLSAAGGLIAGSIVQLVVVLGAAGQRTVGANSASVISWLDGTATAVVGLVGLRVELIATDALNWSDSTFALPVGIGLTAAPLILGLWMLSRQSLEAPALMILTGSLMSAATTVFSGNTNRYFVTSSALIVISIVVALSQSEIKSRQVSAAVVASALAGLWISHFPASNLRATPEPIWSYMLEEARARCAAESERVDVVLRFTPVWPPDEYDLTVLSQDKVPC